MSIYLTLQKDVFEEAADYNRSVAIQKCGEWPRLSLFMVGLIWKKQ